MELTVKQFAKKVGRSYTFISRMVDRVFPFKQGTGKGTKGRLLSDFEQKKLIMLLPLKQKKDLKKSDKEVAYIYPNDFWINPFFEDNDELQ